MWVLGCSFDSRKFFTLLLGKCSLVLNCAERESMEHQDSGQGSLAILIKGRVLPCTSVTFCQRPSSIHLSLCSVSLVVLFCSTTKCGSIDYQRTRCIIRIDDDFKTHDLPQWVSIDARVTSAVHLTLKQSLVLCFLGMLQILVMHLHILT
jgi:hypothetical protein